MAIEADRLVAIESHGKEEENIDGEFQNVLIKRECEKGE